jgi:hypothetical protein
MTEDPTILQKVNQSHRLNLLFKDPEYYSQFNWEPVPYNKPDYYWPARS